MSDSRFDAVVIGAGLGGLTAGALLAKAGRKVCVLERNPSLGGAASVFRSGRLTIEPSLHQTGDPRDPADAKHDILKTLGLLDAIEWVPVRPFLTVRGGPVGEPLAIPIGFEAACEAFAERFPRSRHGFKRLFAEMEQLLDCSIDMRRARDEGAPRSALRGLINLPAMARAWRRSLDEALNAHLGDDEAAKFAFAANLCYYGDDVRRMWWPFFAVAQGGLLRTGGVYIQGGSRVLSMKLAQVIAQAGGRVLLNRDVVAIETDANNRAVGVRHVETRSRQAEALVGAKTVLANNAPSSLAPMLPESARARFLGPYHGRDLSISLFTANFGLRVAPETLGMTAFGEMIAPEAMTNLGEIAEGGARLGYDPGGPLPLYALANYRAIPSGLDEGGLALVVAASVDHFANWESLSPSEEKARRARWLAAFEADLDRLYPGFSAAVDERLFLNARSMRAFLGTPQGAVYGFAPTPPARGLWAGLPRTPKTPIGNLFLASSFGGSGGFTGAMVSGADAARLAAKTG